MSNPVNLDNEQRHPIQTMLIRWINVVITSASVIVAIIISFISLNTVNEVKNAITNQQQQGQVQIQSLENEIEAMQQQYQIQSQELLNELTTIQQQYQTQSQELLNELTTIQQQYQIMENILNQEQTVDVIQARENDVLIRTPDDKWIVVPMIEKIDIEFSSEIIEKQYNVGESNLPRVDLFNDSNGDWSDRDAFTYTIPYLSINQNKMVSLNQFINKMTLEYKFFFRFYSFL